jgi:hypothetical protein
MWMRRFIDAMGRSFEVYWENPRSIAAAVEASNLVAGDTNAAVDAFARGPLP